MSDPSARPAAGARGEWALRDRPAILWLVLAVVMAKEPAQRFPSGHAFAVALEAALQGHIDPTLKRHAEAVLRENPWGMLPNQKS